MKTTKKVLSLLLVIAMIFTLAVPVFAVEAAPATLVSWDGKSVTSNGANDVVKDVALTMNDSASGLSPVKIEASTYNNVQAQQWYGTDKFSDTNFGYVQFALNTEGFENLNVTAVLGGNTRVPASFKLQYSVDGTAFADAGTLGVTVPASNSDRNLETATTTTVELPDAAEDQSVVYVRLAQTVGAAPNASGSGTNAGVLDIYSLKVEGTAINDVTPVVGDDMTGKTVILHSNDVHGSIEGYANMAALKAEYEAKGAEVILADAGDYSQGTSYVSTSKGGGAIAMMNAVGYDVATLGNHEFDYGWPQLKENMSSAEFKVLCADVFENGETIFDGHAIIEKGGVKIGFFGMETPEAQTKANPALIKGLTFLAGDEMYAAAQAQIDALKAEGADLIICLAHLGLDAESEPNRSCDMLGAVTGIDMIIDGHSHTVITATAENPIQSTGTAFNNVGVIVVDNASKAIVDNYLKQLKHTEKVGDKEVTVIDYEPVDAEVAAAAQDIIDRVKAEYGQVFAKSEVELNGDKAPNGNRDSETNMGDLICDAMLWTVMHEDGAIQPGVGGVVAITNGGGIRAWIHKGDISKQDVNTVLPFGNTVAVVYVTGAELLESLEASTYCTPTSVGGFPQVAGIEFTLDTVKEYDANAETYPASTYYGPASINRVVINSVNGQPFDPEATYAVVTNNFCAAGGDTYYAFAAASAQFDTGIPLDEALMAYITDKLDGVVGEEYAAPQGRINILTADTYAGKTVILHSNDVHGSIAGYANMAALKADYESHGANVVLVDAGDYSQGTTYVSTTKGADAIAMMNAVGYDFATLGNHEFDYGWPQLKENMAKANFKVLCADVLENDKTIFDGHAIFEKDGVKIGFFGMETPEAQTKANPVLIKGLTFLAGDEMYAAAQAQIDALKAEGADVIICLAHLGLDAESEPNRSSDMLAAVTGLDMIIDGHSHTVITATAENPIQSTGTAFNNVGVIVVDNASKAIVDNYLVQLKHTEKVGDKEVTVIDYAPTDAEVAAAAQVIIDRVKAEYGQVFAKSEVELNGDKAPNGNRDSETNMGDLICDAMLWTVMHEDGAIQPGVGGVVAITNGGGIRAWIHKGDITKQDVNTVLPFGNTVAVVYVTGAELLESLEASTYCTPTSVGGFPQVAGIDFTLYTVMEYDANAETYPASTYYGPASINRVVINSVNGQPFDPEATYAVVTNNFCAAGGDTYYSFAAASSQFDTGIPLDEALMAFITEELDGVVGEQYAAPQGRITLSSDMFYDIAGSGYHDGIVDAAGYQIAKGYGDGTFRPAESVTRAQFITMLWRAAGEPEVTNTALTFADAGMIADPYRMAVAWGVENGIIKGYGDNTFRPNQTISRAQMATFMARYIESEFGPFDAATKASYGFTDEASFDKNYADSINGVANLGLMNGFDGKVFNANGTATRGQAATVLARLCAWRWSQILPEVAA